jgi:hypothetical protein
MSLSFQSFVLIQPGAWDRRKKESPLHIDASLP